MCTELCGHEMSVLSLDHQVVSMIAKFTGLILQYCFSEHDIRSALLPSISAHYHNPIRFRNVTVNPWFFTPQ